MYDPVSSLYSWKATHKLFYLKNKQQLQYKIYHNYSNIKFIDNEDSFSGQQNKERWINSCQEFNADAVFTATQSIWMKQKSSWTGFIV